MIPHEVHPGRRQSHYRVLTFPTALRAPHPTAMEICVVKLRACMGDISTIKRWIQGAIKITKYDNSCDAPEAVDRCIGMQECGAWSSEPGGGELEGRLQEDMETRKRSKGQATRNSDKEQRRGLHIRAPTEGKCGDCRQSLQRVCSRPSQKQPN
ncbi:hypothetical protein NDU88_001572 [Pleurodeles waltl]|uniref:Uncharacterized protein n=1 Tax=Pleurodeles waltl TaxID=8319 RepID=A0AAV7TI30_PLEWA|nr:hypothetical protein NDU88_001572 [Pleurodeles waltl]